MLEPKLDPTVVRNETDLLAAAIHIDRYVINAMNRLKEEFSGINTIAMQTFAQLNRNKRSLSDLAVSDRSSPGEEVTRNLQEITTYNESMEAKADTPTHLLQNLCACCESSVDYYNEVAEVTVDESFQETAQKLLSTATERMNILKKALGKECGCVG